MPEKYKSRKLLIAVFAIALIVANKRMDLGLDQEMLTNVVMAAAAYIVGEAAVDVARAMKGPGATPPKE